MTVKPEQAVYTLVVGLGKTGLSVVRYLRGIGETVFVVDSRDLPPGLATLKSEFPHVGYQTGGFSQSLFDKAHRIVVSPGVPLSEPVLQQAMAKGVEISGDIDLFAHDVQAPVVGITGSNGKSTVTMLLTAMAKQAGIHAIASGNIGTPVLDSLDESIELYVLELSSFQLESLQRLPMKAAVVLNISADHLDRYDSLASYALSKQTIYSNAQIAVINNDDDLAGKKSASKSVVSKGQTNENQTNENQSNGNKDICFTLNSPQENEFGLCESAGQQWLCFGSRRLMLCDELNLKGRHNIQNVLAALAMGHAIGLPFKSMIETLKSFSGLPHRTQFVARIDDIDWINDSKATNVGAAIAALTGLSGSKVLIAGGIAKDADFTELGEVIGQHCKAVILMGQDADKIAAVIPASVTVRSAGDMSTAVSTAMNIAQAGETVLLAPACASFDMFENFEHRGQAFIDAVKTLVKQNDSSEVSS